MTLSCTNLGLSDTAAHYGLVPHKYVSVDLLKCAKYGSMRCGMPKSLCVHIAVDAGMVDDDFDLWSSLDEVTSGYFPDENYEGNHSSPTSLVAGMTDFVPLYGHDDVFSPVPSTAPAGLSTISAPSAHVTECRQEIPIPPDISPLLRSYHMSSTDEQPTSRVPTPPDITPLLRGALSSANIQLPLPSAQPSSVSLLYITLIAATFYQNEISKGIYTTTVNQTKTVLFYFCFIFSSLDSCTKTKKVFLLMLKAMLKQFFIAHQHSSTYLQYCYSNSLCLSVCLSICHIMILYRNIHHTSFSVW